MDRWLLSEFVRVLLDEAVQLERWAKENVEGGWSTNQVVPMRERAKELRTAAAKMITAV